MRSNISERIRVSARATRNQPPKRQRPIEAALGMQDEELTSRVFRKIEEVAGKVEVEDAGADAIEDIEESRQLYLTVLNYLRQTSHCLDPLHFQETTQHDSTHITTNMITRGSRKRSLHVVNE